MSELPEVKSKKNLYFLIPAVLFIWGFIIYRIVDFTDDGDADFTPRTYATPLRESEEAEQYKLKPRYPDPFLKRLANNAVEDDFEDETPEIQPQSKEETAPELVLNIRYRGFIKASGTDRRIALLVIDGKEVFLKSGDQHNAYVIGQIRVDSLSIGMEDKVRWVRKE